MLAFSGKVCYYTRALRKRKRNPGVAKFGIALEWGSRGLEFESRHSDQKTLTFERKSAFFLFLQILFVKNIPFCLTCA